jgi:CHASE2 domain-containing sensor protein
MIYNIFSWICIWSFIGFVIVFIIRNSKLKEAITDSIAGSWVVAAAIILIAGPLVWLDTFDESH